jgi:raffinose/stachyose/melibiose transport system permease protein
MKSKLIQLVTEKSNMNKLHYISSIIFKHLILMFFSFMAIGPVIIVIINSFKKRTAIFGNPYELPNLKTFSLIGYKTVQARSNFGMYYFNSLLITIVSLIFILFFASMVAFALSEYNFKGNGLIYIYFIIGLIIPIRLGSVSLLRLIVSMNLIDNVLSLILVYTAQGFPLAVFILTQFMRKIPKALKEAARIQGASEYRIYWLVLPLIRPAIATVAAFTIIPIWNDIWFPLILTSGEKSKTVTMGAQQFLGQFANDWNAVLAALSMAIVPVLILYYIFSKQLLSGLTSGAIK